MECSDWILMGTALFLGACALIAPYIAEKLKRTLFKPDLKIQFYECGPFCHKTYWNTAGQDFPDNEPVYYFRFAVINEGKIQARQCEVVLEDLWIYDSSGVPRPYANFSPVNMVWVDQPIQQFISINPERKIFCNIGHISSQFYQNNIELESFVNISDSTDLDTLRFKIEIPREHCFFSQPNCLIPGRYILQVGIYSENACRLREYFDIAWSGNWQDDAEDMFREIVICRTDEPSLPISGTVENL